MPYSLDNWEDISIDSFDAWMMDLQSELEDYESIDDAEGIYQIECEIRLLASRYADQLRKEGHRD